MIDFITNRLVVENLIYSEKGQNHEGYTSNPICHHSSPIVKGDKAFIIFTKERDHVV